MAEVKKGRPSGTEETPEFLIRKELIAHLKLYKSLREMVQAKIQDKSNPLKADELVTYMDLLRRGVVEMAKPIVSPAKAETPKKSSDEENPQKVLDALLGAAL